MRYARKDEVGKKERKVGEGVVIVETLIKNGLIVERTEEECSGEQHSIRT